MFSIPKDNKKQNIDSEVEVSSEDAKKIDSEKMKSEVSEAAAEVNKQVAAVSEAAAEVNKQVAAVTGTPIEDTTKGVGLSANGASAVEKGVTNDGNNISGGGYEAKAGGLENAVGDILSGSTKPKVVVFDEAIHVMPRQFGKEIQKNASRSGFVVITVFILLIVLGLIAGGYYYMKVKSYNGTTDNQDAMDRKIAVEENFSNEAVVSKVNQEELVKEQEKINQESVLTQDEERSIRDSQRLTDIQNIRSALETYHNEFSEYPVLLDDLINTNHIINVPNNPTPGGVDYDYNLSADYSSYTLNYELEGAKGMYQEGAHTATEVTMSTKDDPAKKIQEALTSGDIDATTTIQEDLSQGSEIGTEMFSGNEDVVGQTETKPEPDVLVNGDSDSDGLSNKEEQLLGLNALLADSDSDGYSDLQEILSLNNPNGAGAIIDNQLIKKYINSNLDYQIYYPSVWSVSAISGNNSVILKASDNQSIQILSPDNQNLLSIDEWYSTEVSARKIQDSSRIDKNGWHGLFSADGLTLYLGYPGSNRVFVISYSPGFNAVPDYKNIFTMMINSFRLASDSVEAASVEYIREPVADSEATIVSTSSDMENLATTTP